MVSLLAVPRRLKTSFAVLLALPLFACNPWAAGKGEGGSASASPSVSVNPGVAAGSARSVGSAAPLASARSKPKSQAFNVPVGPRFGIEPGIGIGPIRFGATVATIERLMEAPCGERSDNWCRYPIHAVEFELVDGVLAKIHIQGHERPAKNDGSGFVFGIFNGKLLNGAELGMYRDYAESLMGPAPTGHDVAEGAGERGFQTVYVGEYPGVRLEYDKLANGNIVLAGIVLTKANVSPAASAKPGARPRAPLH